MPPRTVRRSALLIALGGLLSLTGCWSTTRPADPITPPTQDQPRAEPHATNPPPIAWPVRDLAPVQDLAQRTPRTITIAAPHPADAPWSEHFALYLMGRPITFVDHTIAGKGMIRRITRRPDTAAGLRWGPDTPDPLRPPADPRIWRANATFISSRTITARMHDPAAPWHAKVRDQLNRVLERHHAPARLLPDHETFLIDAGLPIRLPDPDAAPKRGLIIHFNSIQPNRFESELLDRLAKHGWAILHVATSAWIDADARPDDLQRAHDARENALARLTALVDQLEPPAVAADPPGTSETGEAAARARLLIAADAMDRLSARARLSQALSTPVRPAGFDLCNQDGPEAVGQRIAGHVDQAIAGHVYAAEAALLTIEQTRPDLASLPVVLLGCSAGAFTVPATAARLGPRVTAAVIIGGGADIFTIARTSSLTSAGLVLRCGDRPAPDALVRRAHDAYLLNTQLDPVRLAPVLAGTPTLHIHADLDTIVPASTGRLLAQRLGTPHRRTLLGGHTLLFLLLPTQAEPIARWLDRHVPQPGAPLRAPGAIDHP